MSALRNLPIKWKMLVLILLVAVFFVANGIINIVTMESLNEKSSSMYNERLLPVQWLSQVLENQRLIDSDIFEIMLRTDPKARQVLKEKIIEEQNVTENVLAAYGKQASDEFETNNLKELHQALKSYEVLRNKVVDMAIDNRTEDAYSYYSLYVDGVSGPKARVNAVLNNLIKYNRDLADTLIQENAKMAQITYLVTFGITLLMLVICIGVGIVISNMITKPINSIKSLMGKAKMGDLSVRGSYPAKDEIGLLTADFNQMISGLNLILKKVSNNAITLSHSSQQLMESAGQTVESANQVARSIQEIAVGTERQQKGAAETAKAMMDSASAVDEIVLSASVASTSAQEATQIAANGHESAKAAERKMHSVRISFETISDHVKQLGERLHGIDQLIDLITNIASQTNLLALNASIEAARAGEHGRGFSVVAQEVRKLAEQSSQSAEKIAMTIREIQNDTYRAIDATQLGRAGMEEGLETVLQAGAAFSSIHQAIRQVAEQVEAVSRSSDQIRDRIHQVTRLVQGIERVSVEASGYTQEIAASSEEQLASMTEISYSTTLLSRMANELNEITGQFHLMQDEFAENANC